MRRLYKANIINLTIPSWKTELTDRNTNAPVRWRLKMYSLQETISQKKHPQNILFPQGELFTSDQLR
jgi:hypothetical protein